MSSNNSPQAVLRLNNLPIKSVKLVDHDFVIQVGAPPLVLPLKFAVALGTFLQLLDYAVTLEEI